MMQHIKLVIFDLDGTLLNTLSDLAHSVNYALKKCKFPIHPIESYKLFVGNGISKLLERSLPENQKTEQNIARLKAFFLAYYNVHYMDFTEPYEGVHELLKTLKYKGLKLAVASNKYQTATEKLIHHFFSDITFTAIFGQREGVPVKPDPAIVSDILQIASVTPEETLYIGDSGVDMKTASNSGVTPIGVTWGFRSREELETAGASFIANTTNDIVAIVQCFSHNKCLSL